MDLTVYAFLTVVGRLLTLLPLGFALALGRLGGALAYRVHLRRRVVLANLRHCLADRTDAELHAIARGAYANAGMLVVEVIRCTFGDLTRARAVASEDIQNLDRMKALKAAKQPVIICTPHHGNFDLGSYHFGLEGLEATIVMKPLESPRLNRVLVHTRERYGMKIVLQKSGDLMATLDAVLRRGDWIALLPDQNAKAKGVRVDFLGQPASLFKGVAALHLDTGAQIVICVDERRQDDPRRHIVHTFFVPPVTPTGDRAADLQALMQTVADRLSELILKRPDQYFWFHRLWGKSPIEAAQAA